MTSDGKIWDDLLEQYRNYLHFERKHSLNTLESYMRDVTTFCAYLRKEFGVEPSDITTQHIDLFMGSIYDKGMKTSSQARTLSGVRSFCNYLITSGVLADTPAADVDSPKISRHLPYVLSIEEIDAIISGIDLSHPQGHRNKAIIECLYSCGLRVSELTGLRLGNIFFDEGFLRVTGKGDKQRLVPLSGPAVDYLKLYFEQRNSLKVDARYSDFVFLNRNGRQLSRVMVFHVVRDAALAAGVRGNVTPHTFRHSFATHLLEGGASIRQVQELLGHESILTTEIYTHLDRSHLRRSLEKHHPLG